jgi:type I restriction enzyme M protein
MRECKGALPREEAKRIRENTYYGQELVARPRRLALMNMYLHGVTPKIKLGDTIYNTPTSDKFDIILANPPFGTKGANQAPERDDFTIATSSKQLNFVQHIMSTLKPGGRAAIVLPDNVLFEDKAGEIFEILMQDCNLHTILRLPRGTFTPYAQGIRANVIFFQKGLPTEKVWIYDNRSNIEGITKKDRPLTSKYFEEFEQCYGDDPNGHGKRGDQGEIGRFRCFSMDEVKKRGYKLDITWMKDNNNGDEDSLLDPAELATEAIKELGIVIDNLQEIITLLESNGE